MRGLVRHPIFAITTTLTLAIGIGANTTVFTLLHGLLLRSLPVAAPHELVRIDVVFRENPRPGGRLRTACSGTSGDDSGRSSTSRAGPRYPVAIEERDGMLHQLPTALVTGNAFELLGLRPRTRPLIGPADDVRGGPAEGWPVVLSDSFWRERFDGDPGVIGSTLRIAGQAVTVVGVTPASFHGVWPGVEPRVYLPMQYINVVAGRDVLNIPLSRVGIYRSSAV